MIRSVRGVGERFAMLRSVRDKHWHRTSQAKPSKTVLDAAAATYAAAA
jgi:hypothetical protein